LDRASELERLGEGVEGLAPTLVPHERLPQDGFSDHYLKLVCRTLGILDGLARVEKCTFDISRQLEDHRAVRVEISDDRCLTSISGEIKRMVEISRSFFESAEVREGEATVGKEHEIGAESEPRSPPLRIFADEHEPLVGTSQRACPNFREHTKP